MLEKNTTRFVVLFGLTLALLVPIAAGQPVSPLTLDNGVRKIHILPTLESRSQFAAAAVDVGPLLYGGGPVMLTAKSFAIFWIPAALQTGAAASMTQRYQQIVKNFFTDYPGHGIANNNTQYSQTVNLKPTYIKNSGSFGGFFVDTAPYPTSGCNDTATPGNCITDGQIQAEIDRIMTLQGWVGGLGNAFFMFTSSGEGSCFDSGSTSCAFIDYCAYHGFFVNSAAADVIYANMPFGDAACQPPGTPSPNNNPAADAVVDNASHELTEVITDPLLNAWSTKLGNEIGDLCGTSYGTPTWTTQTTQTLVSANQSWNTHFYELQEEFDNHTGTCVQLGP